MLNIRSLFILGFLFLPMESNLSTEISQHNIDWQTLDRNSLREALAGEYYSALGGFRFTGTMENPMI